MQLVTRKQWGAAPPRGSYATVSSTRGVKVHYTGGYVSPQIVDDHAVCVRLVKAYQRMHMAGGREQPYMDLGYNLVACPHQKVFMGRGPHHLPAANGAGLNTGHYAILALVGSAGFTEPTDGMLHAIRDGIEYLREHGDAGNEIKGHRDGFSTSCLPLDVTEVLTRCGWVPLGDVEPNDEVASWAMDSGTLTFDHPAEIVEPYDATTVLIDGFETTPDHNWVTYGQKAWAVGCSCGFDGSPASIRAHVREGRRRGEQHDTVREERWKLVRADQMGQDFVYPRAVAGAGAGLDLSDEQIRLMVWLQGDGHFMTENRGRSPSVYGVEWHLRKPRKITRLAGLLRSMDIPFREGRKSNGTVSLRVYGDDARQHVIALLPTKRFHWGLLDMSPAQAEVFLEELLHVDGCVAGSFYCSSEVVNLDVVQAIATLNGQASVCDENVVRFRGGRRNSQWHSRTSSFEEGRTTLVGCLTTVNGTLIVRQRGRTVVIGNCPGDALYAWVKRGAPRPKGGAPSTPTPETADPTEDIVKKLPLLKAGADNYDVKTLRACLFARGGLAEESYGGAAGLAEWLNWTLFDANLAEDVRAFQRRKKLDADGIVGPKTWPALLRVA